jgi:hypothetical protein
VTAEHEQDSRPPLPAGWLYGDQIVAKPLRWLWPGWLPLGVLSLLEGESGCFKSAIARDLAARITTGRPLPGESRGELATVVWITSEEDLGTDVRPLLEAAGADMRRVIVLDDDWSRQHFDELCDVIRDHGVRLVVVDAIKDHIATGGDEPETDVRAELRPWASLARKTGATVIGIRHWRKAAGPAAHRGAGTIGYRAIVRASVAVGQYEGRPCAAPEKLNRGEKANARPFSAVSLPGDVFLIEWGAALDGVTADDLALAQPERPKRSKEASHVDEIARNLLAAGDVKVAHVVAAGACSKDRARAALAAAGATPHGRGPAAVWRRSSGGAPPLDLAPPLLLASGGEELQS